MRSWPSTGRTASPRISSRPPISTGPPICSANSPTRPPEAFPQPSNPRRTTMTRPIPLKKYLIASTLGLGAIGAGVTAMLVPSQPAQAIVVFDPSNYGKNILTDARTLEQINTQIPLLHNQAQTLIHHTQTTP